MIKGRIDENVCKNDFLRLIYNRSLIYSLNIFIIGKGQVGKSTAIFYMANRLKQLRLGIPKNKATWTEWDYKKFTTKTPQKFVKLWDENENEILAMEEAGEQMYYMDWTNIMTRVFSSTTSTHGMKHNVCFLITPYFDDIVKHAKGRLDYIGILYARNDTAKTVQMQPRYTRLNWNSFKHDIKPVQKTTFKYNKKFLIEANKYTDWLKLYKGNIMSKNRNLVDGYNPSKPYSTKNMPRYMREIL